MKFFYEMVLIGTALILLFIPGIDLPLIKIGICFVLAGLLVLKNKETHTRPVKQNSLNDTLLFHSPQGIFIIDENALICDINLKGESWFFGTHDEICGQSLFRNIDCSLRGSRHFKTIFFNDMGTHFPAEVHLRRLAGQYKGFYAVFVEDLTEIVREQDKLLRMAGEDPLTGLLNRRSFLLELKKEMDRSNRTGLNCTIALLDLDHFKEINDTYGHDFGDEVLRVFSAILIDNCRSLDILCRYGGEEFVVLLPHTEPRSALHYLERVRSDFLGHSYSHTIQPTFSCGVTEGKLNGEEGDLDSLLKEVDSLLYKAKNLGRDRIEASFDIDKKRMEIIS